MGSVILLIRDSFTLAVSWPMAKFGVV